MTMLRLTSLLSFFILAFGLNAQILFDNGPLITGTGTGSGGADESILQNTSLGMTTLGTNVNCVAPASLAEDFVVPASGWAIGCFTFYGYQTGEATAPSTFTGAFVQIWDGPPNVVGSNVIWGDLVTNVMGSTSWTGIYRVTEATTGTNTDRPIMEVNTNINTFLSAGTYWVEWCLTGSGGSGPWAPPITVIANNTTGNALQNFGGVWNPAADGGTGTAQGYPFLIKEGNVIPTVSEWGLIILSLLLMSVSLIALRQRKMAMADSNVSSSTSQIPFDKEIYFSVLKYTIGLVLVIAVLNMGLYGTITLVDIVGSLIALPIFTYLLHLMINFSKGVIKE